MSRTINDPANKNYSFGESFDYSVWPKGTQVDLVNVPWNNDYRDVVRFANQKALDEYIDSLMPLSIRIGSMSYIKPGTPIEINLPHNQAQRFNYVRVQNPAQPVPGDDVIKNFYYFILDTKYVSPNNTQLIVQLDVWTTYNFSMKLGNCYVERGHIGIANTNQMQNYGRDYLTVPEGLDVGSDYLVSYNASAPVITSVPNQVSYSVLVASTVNLMIDGGSKEDPVMKTAPGSTFQLLSSGASYYAWSNANDFAAWLSSKQDQPWVTQGIISVSMVPNLSDYLNGINWPAPDPSNDNVVPPYQLVGKTTKEKTFNLLSNWRNDPNIFNIGIPSKYVKLKKFFTYPYMMIELTTWQGTPVVLKPEEWRSADAIIRSRVSYTLPGQRLVAFPQNYNANTDEVTYHDYGEYLDLASIISGFPQGMIVNNSGIAYMAQNAHSIAFQYQSADWSQQRALGSAQASYDIQSGQIGAMQQLTNIGINAATAQTANTNANMGRQQAVNSVAGVLGGAAGGGMGGGAGAALGAVGGVINGAAGNINTMFQQDANTQANAISNRAAREANQAQVGQAAFTRDTNNDLARWAARGDYANQVAGINAKVQDAKMLQPTTSGQIGGDAFNIVNGSSEIKLRWKRIDANHLAMIGDFWLRYGYAINRFMKFPDSYMVMTKFTYWKLTETYISAANIPEGFKQALRGIFEKGVTIWANPKDIGNIDIGDNYPLPGVSY